MRDGWFLDSSNLIAFVKNASVYPKRKNKQLKFSSTVGYLASDNWFETQNKEETEAQI